MNKIGMISLGCPKNQVDSEMLLSSLCDEGFQIVPEAEQADVVIINTCGFIDDAKKEAIDNILYAAELKNDGVIKGIVVTGCLAERYKEEVMNEIPDVDACIGIGANGKIAEVCRQVLKGESCALFPSKYDLSLDGGRMLTTPPHWAYIKIAEGCSNCCTYCAIPSIRGKFRSRAMESIIAEAEDLAKGGIKELIVIAQDITRYGTDLYGKRSLARLCRELSKIDGI